MNSISREKKTNRTNLIARAALGISVWAIIASMAVPTQSQVVPGKVFLYDSAKLSGATGIINHTDATFKTLDGPRGEFSTWSIVVSGGVDILFYNAGNGHAAIGEVDASGVFRTTQRIPDGQIGPGWTHITFHKGFYLFYNKDNGFAAVGNMGSSGFRTYNTWKGSFSRNWSQITSTPNGLLFYNKESGSGEVAEWSVVRSGSGFGYISQVNLNHLKSYPRGFDIGWTHVVNTNHGVLFYCADNGRSVMVDVDTDGSVTTRSRSEKTIAAGYDSILSQNDDVLLYVKSSGDVAIGGFPDLVALQSGLLIRKAYPAYFSPGWTHIVATVDPSIPH
jgi:hypothetical protein